MTLKKLLLIGSISAVVVAAGIIVPIAIVKSKTNTDQETTPSQIVNIDDEDNLGDEMQDALNDCYDIYHNAAIIDPNIVHKEIDQIYVSETSGLHYSTDGDKVYRYSLNSGLWDSYYGGKISLTSVVVPEQAFGGYYVYY